MSEIFIQSIDKRSKLYPSLREMCLNYRFFPFQQLHIEEIATRFSASTTPVREALARLAGEGLIDSVPNRGYFAKHVSLDGIRSRVEILFLLLQHSFVGSSRAKAFDGIRKPADPLDVFGVDRVYLDIAALSGNGLLVPEVERQLALTGFIRSIDLEERQSQSDLCSSLSALLEHLIAGDVEAARSCLNKQHQDLGQRLPELVQKAQLRSLIEFTPAVSAVRPGMKEGRTDHRRMRAIPTRF